MQKTGPLEKLEAALSNTTDVYVGSGIDEKPYFEMLANDIRQHLCDPFPVSALVMPPGFSDQPVGSVVSGVCVARRDGYWLVYQAEKDLFYCFWGDGPDALGAHGVVGSPLYCWSA